MMRMRVCVMVLFLGLTVSLMTPIYDPIVQTDKNAFECGFAVQIAANISYMNCYKGASVGGYVDGGAILSYDLISGNSAVLGYNAPSRKLQFSQDFAVKSAAGKVTFAGNFAGDRNVLVWKDGKEMIAKVIDTLWKTRGGKVALSDNADRLVTSSPQYRNTGIAKYFALSGDQYVFKSNLVPGNLSTNDEFGAQVAFSPDGNSVFLSAPGADDILLNGGIVFQFNYVAGMDIFVEAFRIVPPVTHYASSDAFGTSIAVQTNTLFACSPFSGHFASSGGACHVFQRGPAAPIWFQVLPTPSPRSADQIGSSIAVSENQAVVIVGADRASYAGADVGAVFAFVFNTTTSRYQSAQLLTPPSSIPNTYYGYSVAVSSDGRYMTVGAYQMDLGTDRKVGGSYLYTLNGTTLQYDLITLFQPNTTQYRNPLVGTGLSIAMSTSLEVVMQPTSPTHAFPTSYHTLAGDMWRANSIPLPSGVSMVERYGESVSVSTSQSVMAVSAPSASNPYTGIAEGCVYLFSLDPSTLYAMRLRIVSNSSVQGGFGSSLSFHPSKPTLAVGSDEFSGSETQQGRVYLISYTMDSYRVVHILDTPSPSTYGRFGSKVRLDESALWVSAMNETTSSPTDQGILRIFEFSSLDPFTVQRVNALQGNNSHPSSFASQFATSTDNAVLAIGSPTYWVGAVSVGHVGIYRSSGTPYSYTFTQSLIPLDIRVDDRLGERLAMSPNGLEVMVGTPYHPIDGMDEAGWVYVFVAPDASSPFALSQHITSPMGNLSYAQFGLEVYIHPTQDIRLIGSALSVQEGIDRPTVFVYDNREEVSSTGSTDTSDDANSGVPIHASLLYPFF